MADIINEQNTYVVRVSFKDDSNVSVIPSSGNYRVDDITGGVATEIIANTSFVPAATYHDLVIPALSNAILDQNHDYENRIVTVNFIYGSRQGAGEYQYTLKNMQRIETLLGI
jgi:hypothetical protein